MSLECYLHYCIPEPGLVKYYWLINAKESLNMANVCLHHLYKFSFILENCVDV